MEAARRWARSILPVCLFLSFRYLSRLRIDAFRQDREQVGDPPYLTGFKSAIY